MVAYALYKAEKRDWVLREKKRLGRDLDRDDYEKYAEHFGEETLRRFRQDAYTKMYLFADTYVNDQTPRIREEAVRDVLSQDIRRLETSLREATSLKAAVKANAFASIIVAAVVAAIAFGIVFVPNWAAAVYDWFQATSP